ncbi:MAG: hypothetical protein IJ852_01290 [Alphaproteobacteria bacterium]|nr:hypothetical protein [Alphaproteobacteria bacterium]
MFDLYHYVQKGNNVLQKGLLSFAQNPEADLSYYQQRSGQNTHQEICLWMENCFKGRSRGIRAFTEPIRWSEHNKHCLKDFADQCDLFKINVAKLCQDGLLEAIYVSPSILEKNPANPHDELLDKLTDISEIDYSPLDWHLCDDKLGRRFAYIRYYLLIIQGGIIPPKYLNLIVS